MSDLPEGVEPLEEEQPAQADELGDPAKFTWEDEEKEQQKPDATDS
jgi:hypothetical protein